jgi:hypothetical protein
MASYLGRSVGVIAAGFGALWIANGIGAQGDIARALGNDAAAAGWHMTALFVSLGGLACFVFAMVTMVRGSLGRGRPPAPLEREVEPLPRSAAGAAVEEDSPFDADGIMARYLAARDTSTPPRTGGFGRKQI